MICRPPPIERSSSSTWKMVSLSLSWTAFKAVRLPQLFLIVSFWANARMEAMSELRWDWIDRTGYITIPDVVAKNGRGKVVRIPPGVLRGLQQARQKDSPYVFAGFPDELRAFYELDPRTAGQTTKIKHFTSQRRLRSGIYRHIKRWAIKVGRPGLSHHAIRRTGMELSDESGAAGG